MSDDRNESAGGEGEFPSGGGAGGAGGESEHLNLKVAGSDGSVVHFKIKRNTPLRKLMNAYCDRAGLKGGMVRFMFDGKRLNESDTPTALDMEDGDCIDVVQEQTGGAF